MIKKILFSILILVFTNNAAYSADQPFEFARKLGVKETQGKISGLDPIINTKIQNSQSIPSPDYREAFFSRHFQESKDILEKYKTKDMKFKIKKLSLGKELVTFRSSSLLKSFYVLENQKVTGYSIHESLNFTRYENHSLMGYIQSLKKLKKYSSNDPKFKILVYEKQTKKTVERYTILKYGYETRLILDEFFSLKDKDVFDRKMSKYIKVYAKSLN